MQKIFVTISFLFLVGCSPSHFKSQWTKQVAPESFITRFETSKGNFDIKVKREWSPKAADRFYQLVKNTYFEGAVFYRVIPDFVAQFGSSDSTATANWNTFNVPDEKVLLSNTKGTLSFARSTKGTRTSQLFINLRDNIRLDTLEYNKVKGFPAFGKVTQGMEVVSQLYSGYTGASASKLDLLYSNKKKYFEAFPKLDSIYKVYFIKR